MLEVAVNHHDTHSLRHQIIGEGYAERRLADASFLVGECHYDRCLYHCSAIIDFAPKLSSGEPEKRNAQHLYAFGRSDLNVWNTPYQRFWVGGN
ncbi:hypothetical protein [Bacteroides caccae]|uniref:hypothetical protein n=1 Tax=Bacteroides caccae TaxID=47678 RepID=UPI00293D6D54|nr:hypothetical protein [Bacteroides caccae]